MDTESKLVRRRYQLQIDRGQHLSPLSLPPAHDLEDTQTPSSARIEEQLAYYRSRMMLESVMRRQHTASVTADASAYVAKAQEVHLIEGRKVNIFAPFVAEHSALKTITRGQVIFLGLLGLVLLLALLVNWTFTLAVLLAAIIVFYSGNLLVTFWVSIHTLEDSGGLHIADEVVHAVTGVEWPRYTILCPLYRETEVVAQFAAAMKALDYPADKLQILFLTEADDEATRDAIRAAKLPLHFQIVTVPDGQPRTKPRACNYGVLQATGDYAVIFDAEDIPDPLQLKKAVLTFASHGPELGCVQAKLNFYNTNQNILTRWFTIEYSTWFDTTLPGLQWGQLSLPLGGTSNHFRMSTLRQVGAWDAFNVTEDCDLGLRLSTQGLNTVVLDSTTYEEANPHVKNWIRQRLRWIKGYMQTYLIHMRQPTRYLKPARWREFASLQLIVGWRTTVLLINPVMWIMTIVYFLVWPFLQPTYKTLFPALVLYTAVICLIFGNLAYIYTHFIGCLKRRQYGLVKWTLLMPIYWAMTSYAAYKAVIQLITKPHYWEKTVHGLHLNLPAMTGRSTQTLSAEETQLADAIGAEADSVTVVESPADESNGHSTSHVTTGWIGYTTEDGDDYDGHLAVEPNEAMIPARLPRWRRIARVVPKDGWLLATFITACITSLAATWYFSQQHQLLLYNDSNSHLGIARLLYDSATPGFGQLGGVWLPLPHLLLMPFTTVDYFWRTGLAGACVSMPCYVITAIYIFLTARRLTQSSVASFVGSLVFILNPNVLYLQATPLTEPLATATTMAASYYFLVWLQDDRPTHLIFLAGATFLATLSRYDGWALFVGLFILIPIVSLVKRQTRHRIEANTIVFALFGCLGIAIWLGWNTLIFGDPLYFQHSEYSGQAQVEVIRGQGGPTSYQDLKESIYSFSLLSFVILGPDIFVLSVIGLVVFIIQHRFSLNNIAVLVFLLPFAFYVFSLYKGQTLIYLPQLVAPDFPRKLFNDRYGMVVIPPAAIFLASYVAWLSRRKGIWLSRLRRLPALNYRFLAPIAFTFIIIGQSFWTAATGVVTLQDGQFGASCSPPQKIADYLARYYDGDRILLDIFYNSGAYVLGPVAGVEYKNLIYQGSGPIWQQALQDPTSYVNWIIVGPAGSSDKVAQALDPNSLQLRLDFALVATENWGARLYRRTGLPAPVEHPIRPETVIDNRLC